MSDMKDKFKEWLNKGLNAALKGTGVKSWKEKFPSGSVKNTKDGINHDMYQVSPENERIVELNRHYKEKLNWNLNSVYKAIHVHTSPPPIASDTFIRKIKHFQKQKDLDSVDGIIGPSTWNAMEMDLLSPKDKALKKISSITIQKESGGDYDATNLDGEYKGVFNSMWQDVYGENHPAYKKTHIGLSFGVIQWTQDSGSLGDLLQTACKRKPDRFKQIFGETWQELLSVVTAEGRSGLDSGKLRGPRVQKVPVKWKGELVKRDLWKEPWVSKFRAFGRDTEMKRVQDYVAVRDYLKPQFHFMKQNHLVSEKMVAAIFSASIHRGVYGGRSFVRNRIEDVGNDDKDVLKEMASIDRRYQSYLDSKDLTWDEWVGFQYFS